MVFGLLLIALGLAGYYGTGTSSLTALTPAAFGLAMAVCGVLAGNADRRKLAMHIAVGLAALGFIACVPGLFKLPMVLARQEVARPAAVWSQSAMALLTGIYLVVAFKSFPDARKKAVTPSL